ncbi:MAG: IclR family transcriptional regulator [Maioricimonas sp. JB049]
MASTTNRTASKAAGGNDARSYSVPAVDKALDVLELLGEAPRGMSLTGIADALGRTKQELFRVLVCLHERGYLVRDEGQFYHLSTKLFEIGSRHPSTQTLVARALPHMERLTGQLGESCHLTMVVQKRMLVVARIEADSDVVLTVRVGASFPLHTRTSGLVGLAYQSDHRRQEYWSQIDESDETIAACEARLATIRSQGYAVADSATVIGARDCATPILGSGASLLGVLSVSYVQRVGDPVERPDIVDAVVEAARAISAEYGPVPDADEAELVIHD